MLAICYAVEQKYERNAEIIALSMGPPQARDALIYALSLGADRAIHLTDHNMAGSDTLATARTLAMYLKSGNFDLILCGRNSSDSETGQVGPEIAELLKVPHISRVSKIEYEAGFDFIAARRETEEGFEIIRTALPALVTVTEGISTERYPSKEDIEAVRNHAIEEVNAPTLSLDTTLFGIKGSPTRVENIRTVESKRLGILFQDENPLVVAQELAEFLQENISKPTSAETFNWNRYQGANHKAIWVVAESFHLGPRRVTLELLGVARQLAETTTGEVAVILLGKGSNLDIETLGAYGADRVYLLDNETLGHPISPAVTAFLSSVIVGKQPYAILFPSDSNGRDIASRIAARLGLGLTGDCVGLEINDAGELVHLKPAFGGNVMAPIISKTRPYMSTLLPGVLNPISPCWDTTTATELIKPPPVYADKHTLEILEVHKQIDAKGFELDSAQIVLGIGMGIGGPDNMPMIVRLADSIGASISATRNVTDSGWLPRQVQVGLSGKAIAPKIYLALGIRGAFNHMVGIQRAGTIIAINENQRAPIFKNTDYGIIGDWQEYLPPLIEAMKPILRNII